VAADRLGIVGGLAVGVVLGFVLGGIGPRRELASTQAELSAARDQIVELQARQGRRSPLGMLGLGGGGGASPAESEEQAPAPPSTEVPTAEAAAPEPVVADVGERPPPPEPQASRDLASFDAAVEAQRIRREQSRAALIEQADLDDQQIAELDAAIAEMNVRFGEMSEELLDLSTMYDDMGSSETLHAVHEVTGVLYDTQVELEAIVGEDQLDAVDPDAREIWNYIDLEAFRDTVEAAQDQGPVDP